MIVCLYSVAEVLAALLCLFSLYNRNFRLNFKLLVFICGEALCMFLIALFHCSSITTLIPYLAVALYVRAELDSQISGTIVNMTLCSVYMLAAQLLGSFLYRLIFGTGVLNPTAYLEINVFVLLLTAAVVKRLKLNAVSNYFRTKGLESLFSVILSGIVVLYICFGFKLRHVVFFTDVLIVVLLVIYICAITASERRYKKAAMEKEEELRIREQYMELYKGMVTEIKAKQHDFDNHMIALQNRYSFEAEKNMHNSEQFREYIAELGRENKFNKMLISGNPIVIAFLYSKFTDADNQNIDITYRLDFGELKCGLPISKLIRLIGNLFDNAVRAEASEPAKRIDVRIVEYDMLIEIEIRNLHKPIPLSVMSRFFEKGYSADGEHHGYGLYNVKKICGEYKLDLYCSNRIIKGDNWVSFKVVIHKNQPGR